MSFKGFTLTWVTLLVAAGCAPIQPSAQPATAPVQPAPQVRVSESAALLAFFDANRDRTAEELRVEIAGLRRRVAETPSALLRLQLATLLTAPYNDNRDYSQALKLLDDVSKDPQASSGSLRHYLGMLQGYAALSARQEDNVQNLSQRVKEERRRTEQALGKQDANTQQLEQKLKDEQRRNEIAQAKQEDSIQQLTAKLREEQKRAEELQQKLDAIMKIEKSLIERQQPKEAPK